MRKVGRFLNRVAYRRKVEVGDVTGVAELLAVFLEAARTHFEDDPQALAGFDVSLRNLDGWCAEVTVTSRRAA